MFRGKIRHVAKSEVYNKPLASTGMAGYDESWFPLVPSPNARACRLLSPLGPLVRLPVPAAHWALAPPPPVRPVRQHHWPEQRTTTKHTKKGRRTAEAIACLFLPVGAADCKAVNWLRRPATPVLRACVRACEYDEKAPPCMVHRCLFRALPPLWLSSSMHAHKAVQACVLRPAGSVQARESMAQLKSTSCPSAATG